MLAGEDYDTETHAIQFAATPCSCSSLNKKEKFTISSLFFSCSAVQNPFCSWYAASRFPKKWGVKQLRVGVKLALIVTFLFGRQSPQQRVSRWPEGWADIWNNFIRHLEPENRGGPLSLLNPTLPPAAANYFENHFFQMRSPGSREFWYLTPQCIYGSQFQTKTKTSF